MSWGPKGPPHANKSQGMGHFIVAALRAVIWFQMEIAGYVSRLKVEVYCSHEQEHEGGGFVIRSRSPPALGKSRSLRPRALPLGRTHRTRHHMCTWIAFSFNMRFDSCPEDSILIKPYINVQFWNLIILHALVV
jgi:hypothetical protein